MLIVKLSKMRLFVLESMSGFNPTRGWRFENRPTYEPKAKLNG